MDMDNEITTYQGMPAALIEKAIAGNADLEKLEKLLELQERWERNEAKKAYVVAMAAFKANAPEIEKDKKVDFTSNKTGGKTSYNHASLANVTKKVSSELSKHGLSASWSTTQNDNGVCVSCTITHVQGHSETTSLTAAPDTSGNKNTIQAIGSTISYLERYTLLAMLGLATHDQDDDGKTSEAEFISIDQQTFINDEVEAVYGPKANLFWKYMGVESADKITVDKYKTATYAIENVKARQGAKK
jgi:hypothetical protein